MIIINQSAKPQLPEDGMELLRRVERAGRNCYRSECRITENSALNFVGMQLRRGHLSPMEFADITVELVTSRDVMAELTRHRLASFCIESQRYVTMNGDIAFICPIFCRDEGEACRFWKACMEDAERAYHTLQQLGCKPEDARKVLPNSTATRIVMKANLREWRHILAQRTSKAAYPEIREQMTMLLQEMRQQIPVVFDDLEVGV